MIETKIPERGDKVYFIYPQNSDTLLYLINTDPEAKKFKADNFSFDERKVYEATVKKVKYLGLAKENSKLCFAVEVSSKRKEVKILCNDDIYFSREEAERVAEESNKSLVEFLKKELIRLKPKIKITND
jgi:hypothetical protein